MNELKREIEQAGIIPLLKNSCEGAEHALARMQLVAPENTTTWEVRAHVRTALRVLRKALSQLAHYEFTLPICSQTERFEIIRLEWRAKELRDVLEGIDRLLPTSPSEEA